MDSIPTVIDGLIVSRWSRDLFEQMRKGNLTAANCTCSVWENFDESMRRLAEYKRLINDNSDIVIQAYDTSDIIRAKESNKTAIYLGWQNTSGIEDKIQYLKLFHELGVRVMQLTYNTQNLVGSGCYESSDGGLSDFGREVVEEMNDLGILIDLSHVGSRTADDAIRHSTQPVCYSHVAPAAFKQHPRCKTDEQLRFIIDRGGFVGVTPFPPFMPKGANSTIDDFIDVLEYVIGLIGEERVGFGTDFSQGDPYTPDYWVRDKGYARQLVDFGTLKYPDGFEGSADYGNFVIALDRRGWPTRRIESIVGSNWLSFLKEVWGA